MGTNFPSPGATVGCDFVGTIVRIDTDTDVAKLPSQLKVGDLVCGAVHGSNPADHQSGAFAEYVRAPADLLLKVPKTMAVENAATLGVALGTAWMALWESLRIPATPERPAETPFDVFVYGGSTTCGTMAIQMLKLYHFPPIWSLLSSSPVDMRLIALII